MSQTLGANTYYLTNGTEEKSFLDALGTALNGTYKVTLSAAAEAGDAIVVSGAITDLFGKAITAARMVTVTSTAVTADKGDITVVSGTEHAKQNPATGDNVAAILSTAAGLFSFSVANTVAEKTVVTVCVEGGLSAVLTLQFA